MGLSRNHSCEDIVIVGEREQAIDRMLKTLTQKNQWTALTEDIVANLSLTGEGVRSEPIRTLDIADTFPFRVCDLEIPSTNSGFVYLLVSTREPSSTYVGTTANLKVRLDSHNSGRGSYGTDKPHLMPWFIASYMCNMIHMTTDQRKSLEWVWQRMNLDSQRNGRGNLEQYIENGRFLCVQENTDGYGAHRLDERLNYVICVNRRFEIERMEEPDGSQQRAGRNESLNPLPNCTNGSMDDSSDDRSMRSDRSCSSLVSAHTEPERTTERNFEEATSSESDAEEGDDGEEESQSSADRSVEDDSREGCDLSSHNVEDTDVLV